MYLGIDIGGTKCAVICGTAAMEIVQKESFATEDVHHTLERIFSIAERFRPFEAIGISCGGPLDSRKGSSSPRPTCPGWTLFPSRAMLQERFGVPAYLLNDANACTLAEWKFGAGRGSRDMLFLTFGTGLGAGMILNGRLHVGASDMAGEVGHIRLCTQGPVGYGKRGSFEGFCSGGGLAQLGQTLAREQLQQGKTVGYCHSLAELPAITAKSIAEAAANGDETAVEVYRLCGEKLGYGLSVLIDTLNPDTIVIGSIFQRAESLLRPAMEAVIAREALPAAAGACRHCPRCLRGTHRRHCRTESCRLRAGTVSHIREKEGRSNMLNELLSRYPALAVCRDQLQAAMELLYTTYCEGGRTWYAAMAGSCADSEHIVGELVKGFLLPAPSPQRMWPPSGRFSRRMPTGWQPLCSAPFRPSHCQARWRYPPPISTMCSRIWSMRSLFTATPAPPIP